MVVEEGVVLGKGHSHGKHFFCYKIIPCLYEKKISGWKLTPPHLSEGQYTHQGRLQMWASVDVPLMKLLTKVIRSLKLKAALLWITPSTELMGVTTKKIIWFGHFELFS